MDDPKRILTGLAQVRPFRFAEVLPPPYYFYQAYEMWESGWSFQVLSPVFAVHYGFQEKKTRPGIILFCFAVDNLKNKLASF